MSAFTDSANDDSRPKQGFVYVATGQKYVDEAALSAASLKRFHQEPVCLITNAPTNHTVFDEVIIQEALPNNVGSKLAMDACPYDRFVFLDSDTYIVAPLNELFELLDAFDIGVPAALGGFHYQLPGVSPAFREPMTNVIAMRRSLALTAFFEKWRHYYAEYETIMGREWDQRSFRHAAYETEGLRITFLGDEWSLSPYPGGLLCRDVRIFHGRPRELLYEMEKIANRRLGYRVFWRGFGCIGEPYTMRPAEHLRVFLRSALQSTKALVRPFKRTILSR
ncbi:MAG: hypothetical protein VKK04_23355 [Synechococcales bacterium]|nr:hypothetical protein [Synechococcales bacterium]